MFFSGYKKRIAELEEEIKRLREMVEKSAQQSQGDKKAQEVKLDAAIENMKNLQEMSLHYLEKEIATLLAGTAQDKAALAVAVKEAVLASVEDFTRQVFEDKMGELIYERAEQVLTLKIRSAVIKRADGQEISQDSLDYIIDTIVAQILPEIIKKPSTSRETGSDVAHAVEEVVVSTASAGLEPGEMLHETFPKMLDCIKAGLIPMLVGPAGTGKSTAVEQAARVLGLKYYMANRVANTYELTGYSDANGKFVETQFYKAYKNGGVFLFDEIDGSDPEALVTINTAIAQGYMAFPCGLVQMHPDFHMVAAGNTYGKGADAEYVGRNQLDSATLDRFVVLDWDYDKNIEKKLCPDKKLLEFVWALRKVIDKNHLKIIISTRGIKATYKLLQAGSFSLAENLKANLLEGVSADTLNTIKGGLINLCGLARNNKYIKAIDELIEEKEMEE